MLYFNLRSLKMADIGAKFKSFLEENGKPQDSYDLVLPLSKYRAFLKDEGLTEAEVKKFEEVSTEITSGLYQKGAEILEAKVKDAIKEGADKDTIRTKTSKVKVTLPDNGMRVMTMKALQYTNNPQKPGEKIPMYAHVRDDIAVKGCINKDLVTATEEKFKKLFEDL
jgi:hypothetical protein